MDDCKLLASELDELKSWYRWEIIFCVLKALLALLGLDWVVDVLRGRKTFGEAFGLLEAFITALLTLDIYLVIKWLRNELPKLLEVLPLGKALKQQIKKLLGPIALAFLIVDLGFAVKGFFDCRKIALNTFNIRVKDIYDSYECETKDKIFKKKGVAIPN